VPKESGKEICACENSVYCIQKKERQTMNTFKYIVDSIDGDYAYLRKLDEETGEYSEELKLVARALLPAEIMEGTMLLYEWMQYSII
jgi:hypothetical protein